MVRLEIEGLAVIGSGCCLVAEILVHGASTCVGVGIARVELDGNVEVGERSLILALVGVGQRPIEERARIVPA